MTQGASRHHGGVSMLRVARRIGGRPHEGRLIAGDLVLACALGRSGITRRKREGDGATPAGSFTLLSIYLRRGRAEKPRSVAARFVRPDDLWCDDARSFLYNRPLRGKTPLSHERLWRADRLYDVVGVLDYNIRPRVLGRGSAIFFHIATQTLGPTAGCVALRARDMARLLPRLAAGVRIVVD
ncbi:L,D-peptidoglycan transpeptidase YkuD (ErfK/YbiS/YcfS/YnhG family) [Methylosinus sp. sav-2]|uniref:L,D-transpeptidase family protein n=1 Tax=unclassified Methylosinus TaxID=2624500 RepID=UPI000463FE2E|nr:MULTISPECIES: L,D-transpeptidase family protein [unclassified Methylosinus]TDX67530.1 L,D-peptidoglycan transpeptidase YkuD (ErfK/YbiS/YcfS/YnhG family) [Methylosinus sp. sav-2]